MESSVPPVGAIAAVSSFCGAMEKNRWNHLYRLLALSPPSPDRLVICGAIEKGIYTARWRHLGRLVICVRSLPSPPLSVSWLYRLLAL
jgi:hypothetical protein